MKFTLVRRISRVASERGRWTDSFPREKRSTGPMDGEAQ